MTTTRGSQCSTALPDKKASGAIVVAFDSAMRYFKQGRPATLIGGGEGTFHCVGFPAATLDGPAVEAISQSLQVQAVPLDIQLTVPQHKEVYEEACARIREIESVSPLSPSETGLMTMKLNDRLAYRMIKPALLARVLEEAFAAGYPRRVVVPWLADEYGSVERPGVLGFNSPGHQVQAVLLRLQLRWNLQIESLGPELARAEKGTLRRARVAMSVARIGTLVARSVRDKIWPRPCGTVPVDVPASKPAIGFVVGGASCWYHLSRLHRASIDRFQPVVIAHDIFRNPSSYKTLLNQKVPFVPIGALTGVAATVTTLVHSELERRKSVGRLSRQAHGGGVLEREAAVERTADLESHGDLALYVRQLREAIRRFRLRAVVSANCIDSYLSAGSFACREEGIPHLVIQNTPHEEVRQPVYCDCDAYFAESEHFATFLRSQAAVGPVCAMGLPYYDELLEEAGHRKQGPILQAYPHLAGKTIVSLMTGDDHFDYTELIDAVMELIEERNDLALVVRLHPRASPDLFKSLGARLESAGRGGRMQHTALSGFLGDTDYLLTAVSTTAHWAIAMGIRPFAWVPADWTQIADEVRYLDPSVTTRSADSREIVAKLRTAITDPGDDCAWEARRRLFIDKHMTGADGMACGRILDYVSSICGASQRHVRAA